MHNAEPKGPLGISVEGFLAFIASDPWHFPEDSTLADYIDYWLWDGEGVFKCFGDYEIFLKTIPLIVDAWHRDPTILDYVGETDKAFERRVTSFCDDFGDPHPIFSRDNFVAAAFHWQYIK